MVEVFFAVPRYLAARDTPVRHAEMPELGSTAVDLTGPGRSATPGPFPAVGLVREAGGVMYPRTLILPEPGSFPNEKALAESVLNAMSKWFSVETEVRGRYRGVETVRIDAVLRPLDPEPWADDDPAFGVEFKLPTAGMGDRDYFVWAAQAVDYAHTDWDGYGRLQIFVCPSPIMAVWLSSGQLADWQARVRRSASLESARDLERIVGRLGKDEGLDEEQERRAQRAYRRRHREQEDEDHGALLEGFRNSLDRNLEQSAVTGRAMMHLLGQLNVGELTQVRDHGWSLLRSGHTLWCSHCGVRSKWSLKPQLASRS